MKTEIYNLEKLESRMKNVFKASKGTIENVISQVRALNEGKDFAITSVFTKSSKMFKHDGTFAIISNAEVHLDYYDNNWKAFFTVIGRK